MEEVIIIGAGASGLIAALELVRAGKKVLILEASERAGGRIHTIYDKESHLPIELGAEFVHGNLENSRRELEHSGSHLIPLEGSVWRKTNGRFEKSDFVENFQEIIKKLKGIKNDIPIGQFTNGQFDQMKEKQLIQSVTDYVEGYYAAEVFKASTFAFRDELVSGDEDQFIPDGSYNRLVQRLLSDIGQGNGRLQLCTTVRSIEWDHNEPIVKTTKGNYCCKKILFTPSLGVLRSGQVAFHPSIQNKTEAARQLGYGSVARIVFLVHEPFWKDKKFTNDHDLSDLGFLFSEEAIPTWWTRPGSNGYHYLTGWAGGPKAKAICDQDDELVIAKAKTSLLKIFNLPSGKLDSLIHSVYFKNWENDANFCGGYSYEVVNGDYYRSIMREPLNNTVFFCGEGLHGAKNTGTVEAALASGKQAAHEIVTTLDR